MRAFRFRRALWLFFIAFIIIFFASNLAAAPASSDGDHHPVHVHDDDNHGRSKPDISKTWLEKPVSQILYFDDSDSILALPQGSEVQLSEDGGTSFKVVHDLGENIVTLRRNPHSKRVAIALGKDGEHWITKNRGKDWKSFKIEGRPVYRDDFPFPILSWHAGDENKIIMNTRITTSRGIISRAIYTNDGFDSEPKTLRDNARQCLWANEQEHFKTQDSFINKDRTLCVAFGKYSAYVKDQRLLVSDNYFDDEREPNLEWSRPVAGIVSIVTAKAFILAARKTEGTTEMALYITTNTKWWWRAQFGEHQIVQDGYTVMESTNYSLQVDVSASVSRSVQMGTLYTSNSRGRSFVRNEVYTNRSPSGWVDFEKIAGIQGVALVNVVDNAEKVIKAGAFKKIKSQITFDDGRTFHDLKTIDEDDKPLHLHSATERDNVGRTFSNLAPGIVMGNGNTGDQLKEKQNSDLWVSDDAGRTFRKALEGPHLYEIGDQGSVILAIEEEKPTKSLSYSLDHGKNWQKILLKDYDLQVSTITAQSLSNLPDSTSLKFLLTASAGSGSELDYFIFTLDFAGLGKGQCKPKDMEEWYARVGDDDEPTCIMGHTQKFRRRKADADCFIGIKFKDPKPEEDNCKCTDDDYECDADFVRSKDRKTCNRLETSPPPPSSCKKDQKTFEDRSGFRKIPGNTCIEKREENPEKKKVERPCPKDDDTPPSSGEISSTIIDFDADKITELYYLPRGDSSTGNDETIILLTNEHEVWVSHDHGKRFDQVDIHDRVIAIYPHRYFGDQVYLITPTKKVYYSKNRAKDWDEFDAPGPPVNRLPILRFHPTNEDWLIWTSCLSSKMGEACKAQAHISTKNGAEWKPLLKAVEECEFIYRDIDREGLERSKKMIYCIQHDNEDQLAPKQLLSSEDWFEDKKVLFSDMIHFATMSEYVVVANKIGKNNKWLQVDASIDGSEFANAKLPANLQVLHSNAYTVLDSSTHSIFLHVTINQAREQEYGSIVKSNSNGTSYTMCLPNVNRNQAGYVDFEKMQALPGTAIANVIENVPDMLEGREKKLKTMITHDDGATWRYIKPPEKDASNKKYRCPSRKLEECSLHLHGFTERPDPQDTYSSPAAVGLVLGIGNVGEYLLPKRDCDTWVSRDGGVTWKKVMEGQYMWEFGDRGGIIVIVDATAATNQVFYSTNEGESWNKYEFSSDKITIDDITTVPSDTSRNFLLRGRVDGRRATTINLDFTGLTSKECNLNKPGTKQSDYELWQPKHPDFGSNKDNCLFGHVSEYLRKKLSSDCYNPPNNFPDTLINIKKNCSCTRQDFECDYNYERHIDGSCKLVPGNKPKDHSKVCNRKGVTEWWEPTGYRRLPLSTCEGGKDLERVKPQACPGKEDDFAKKHPGISGVGLFFAIIIPVGAAGAIGYWMWRNMEGRFGRIRLGDAGGDRNIHLSAQKIDWTRYPIMMVSGVVAVVMAVPMLLGVLWRSARERLPGGRRSFYSTYGRSGLGEYGNGGPYTSRDSFARGGRDYSDGPHNDERDLLGDDSDEE